MSPVYTPVKGEGRGAIVVKWAELSNAPRNVSVGEPLGQS